MNFSESIMLKSLIKYIKAMNKCHNRTMNRQRKLIEDLRTEGTRRKQKEQNNLSAFFQA